MAVRLSVILEERCDWCGQITKEPILNMRYKSPEQADRTLQFWLHPTCMKKLMDKGLKLIERVQKKYGIR